MTPAEMPAGGADLRVRLQGAKDAIDHVHPLCNPYLRGPEDKKREWLLGYSFAQKLNAVDRARLAAALSACPP